MSGSSPESTQSLKPKTTHLDPTVALSFPAANSWQMDRSAGEQRLGRLWGHLGVWGLKHQSETGLQREHADNRLEPVSQDPSQVLCPLPQPCKPGSFSMELVACRECSAGGRGGGSARRGGGHSRHSPLPLEVWQRGGGGGERLPGSGGKDFFGG